MKASLKSFALFTILICLITLPQALILHHVFNKRKMIRENTLEAEAKIAQLETNKKDLDLISKKTLKLEKTHKLELNSLKENKLEGLFFATQLARKHQLILIKSSLEEPMTDSKNFLNFTPLTITLSGGLAHLYDFLREFSRCQKALRLTNIKITTQPNLCFQIYWDAISEEG